jgi:WD40 repeat protein
MPKDADPLTAEQIALIRRWVSEGASFDGADPKAELASIIPKAPQPDPPAAYRAAVPITALAFHPQGTEIAVGGYHEITVWNTADGSLLRRIKNVAQRTYGLVYNADGSFLAAASGTPGILGEVKLFNPADGSLIKDLCGLSDVALDVAFSPQGDKLAACSADRTIRVFDVASGAQDLLIEDHADWVMAVAWSPDGSRLASASRDKTSKVFDAKTGESQITYPGHGDTVYGVAFAADGQQVLTGGADRKIHAWAVADAKKTGEAGGFGHDVYKVILAEGQIFAPSADKQAHQFAADSKNPVRKYSGHSDWVYSISFCPATRRLAAGSFDGEVRIWNTEDGAAVLTFKAAPGLPPSSPPAG